MNTTEMNIEEKESWLAARKLGSSDAAAALGLNPFKSPYQLWAEKTGRLAPVEENEAMLWGKLLEPVIALEFAKRNGLYCIPANDFRVHPQHEWMTATPDFYAPNEKNVVIPIECKNVSYFQSEKYASDEIPDHVHVQLLHQMCVLGVNTGYVVALLGGNNLVWRKVETDDFQWLIDAERQFWSYVENDTPPPLRAGDGDVLGAMYPESEDSEYNLSYDAEVVQAVEDFKDAREIIAAAEEACDIAVAKIKNRLGPTERAICGDHRIVWKTITSNRVDTKAMEADHPAIVSQYRKPSTSRRFEVKPIKKAK